MDDFGLMMCLIFGGVLGFGYLAYNCIYFCCYTPTERLTEQHCCAFIWKNFSSLFKESEEARIERYVAEMAAERERKRLEKEERERQEKENEDRKKRDKQQDLENQEADQAAELEKLKKIRE